ncbi:MAG TPA: hypothetical protein VJV78_10375 [Polyangiales bacterium]|nr:hypothetical protein [Polyangiales bacterium]
MRVHATIRLALACFVSALSTASSCASDGGPKPEREHDEPPLDASCAALEPSCLENQKVCVAGAEPRCEACPPGEYASRERHRCVRLAGEPLRHEFADFTVGPSEEVLGSCQSWTLGNAEEIWVNAVELEQNAQSHHSNWLFVPSDKFDGPDGVWPCPERGYTQLAAALAGGVLYAQSTQAKHEVQKFPEGAAVRIPPYARIIGDVHLLNVTERPVTGRITLSLYALPVRDVSVKLAPFHLTYDKLDIPPGKTSRFFGECDIEQALSSSLSMQLYFLLPHTHALGTRYFVELLGGPRDGESLIDVRGFNGEGRGRYYDPPVDVEGARGFRFGCEFDNPRAEAVHWGFGDQEMCENLGFIASDYAFESTVKEVVDAGVDGDIPTFTGSCTTLAFKYDQTKAGGPPQ